MKKKKKVTSAQDGVLDLLIPLNNHLANRRFLVGDEVSIADIGLTCAFLNSFKAIFTKEYLESVPHVVQYFKQNLEIPQFKEVIGEAKLLIDQTQKTEL